MKLHTLRDFVAVAKSGGIRAAARQLRLSQPALSKSISQLESELGTPLFERTVRGSTLNYYGAHFLIRAESALHELARGRDEIQQMRGSTGGNVSFAASSVVALSFLTSAMSRFRRRYPHANVRIHDGTYGVMLSGLRERSLDFAVGPVPTAHISDDLVVEHLFDNSRCVIGRIGHPLSNSAHLSELLSAEWLTTSAVGPQDDEFREIFEQHGLTSPASITRCDSLVALIALLSGTDALAFLPKQWASSRVTRQILLAFPIEEVVSGPATCLLRPNGLPLTPAAEALADAIRSGAADRDNQ